MQHFDCLQLEFLQKQIWGCYTGGVQLKLKYVFDGFYGKQAGLVGTLAELGRLVCPEDLRLAK